MSDGTKILIIKLGALGDFIQAMGPMAAIRRHHPQAHITLLTTNPFREFAFECGYFDEVVVDDRPKALNLGAWGKLKKFLNDEKFNRVYDLQNNDRTGFYFKLFDSKNRPEWVGIAKGASHQNKSPTRSLGHAFDGHVETLALAGITDVKIDSLEWLQANISSFAVRKPFVLLVPGSAPSRPEKRWPADRYAELATILIQLGYQPVIIGGPAEHEATHKIMRECPQAMNLAGITSLGQIVALARNAAAAIGNDTGPIHLIAATGCPVLSLFSAHSDVIKHGPRGERVEILAVDELNDLSVDTVLRSFHPRFEPPKRNAVLH